MNPGLEEEVQIRPSQLQPLTVEQYHRMIETGILEGGTPIELLDGLLVRKIRGPRRTVSPAHRLIVRRLVDLSPLVEPHGYHIQLQAPLTIEPSHEPEPDGLIVRGDPEDFGHRHPTPGEVACVIEVSDTSLTRDRTSRQRIYAAAGIPQYVIVNLVERQIELYQEPDEGAGSYATWAVFTGSDRLSLQLGDAHVAKTASEWLPAGGSATAATPDLEREDERRL